MNRNLIIYYVILSLLTILCVYTFYKKKYLYTYTITGLIVGLSILIFFYSWREDFNVHPMNDKGNNRKKVLWINVDKIDILNDNHNKWAKNLLLKQAPNKLGIYSDKYNVTTLDILRYKETFFELFNYNPEYIYFKNAKLNNKTKQFCKDKNLKISSISLRIN